MRDAPPQFRNPRIRIPNESEVPVIKWLLISALLGTGIASHVAGKTPPKVDPTLIGANTSAAVNGLTGEPPVCRNGKYAVDGKCP